MTSAPDALHHLVQIIRTGNEFYEYALDRINDEDLEACLDANLADRRQMLDEFQAIENRQAGTREQEQDLEARLEEDRAEMEVVLKSNDRYVYFDHLAALEEKTKRVYTEARQQADSQGNPERRAILQDMESTLRRVRERVQSARDAATNREAPPTLATRIVRQDRRP
jgi:uncharacterized protein (TIGR02284 family)